jgi:hypothetical protein
MIVPVVFTKGKTKMMRARKSFTLAEVLLATFVAAVTLCVIMVTYIRCLDVINTSQNINKATNAAQGLMATIRNTPFLNVYDEYDNTTFEVDNMPPNRGSVDVDDENPNPNLLQVTISVCWNQGGRIVGSDTNLDGQVSGGEADNGADGIVDSPVQIVTIMANR